ncbi:MAG: 4Fe-4S dicluster domain-containing protein [Faecalibacterium sp.]
MGFFTRTAMDMLMKTTHPEINRRQCWNLHPHRKPCTECKDICPYGEQIFTRPNLVKDWDPCTECGLCVSACRSGCIIPSPEQVQRDTSAADTDNDTIWIGCEKSTRKNSMVRACISALTWETLAYLALNKKIVLDLTPCGECENDLCAAQLRKELTRLVDFFGQPMFEARFTLAYEQDEAPYHVKELSRREMFEQVSHGSKSGTKKLLQLLPGLRSEDDGGVDFRLLLHQRTKQLKAAMDTPLKYGYYLPNFTDKCFGCGKCEKACRAGALKLEDLPDGQTRIVITPWKCSECEVCVASCSNQWHRRHEAAPAHHPWPGECTQMHQDPVQGMRQAHCAGQCGWCVHRVPHQGPHQKAAGRSRCPGKAAAGGAGGQKGCRGSRQGSGGSRCTLLRRLQTAAALQKPLRRRLAAGSVTVTPDKQPRHAGRNPCCRTGKHRRQDVPDTPKND